MREGTGIAARAVVRSVTDTGVTETNRHVGQNAVRVRYDLEVHAGDQPPYDVVHTQPVPRLMLSAASFVGVTLPIRIDPADRTRAHIAWNEFGGGGGGAGPVAFSSAPVNRSAAAPVAPPSSDGSFTSADSAAGLLATGTPGRATIQSFQPLGTARSLGVSPSTPAFIDDPVYLFEATVDQGTGARTAARFGHRVPAHLAGSLEPGMVLPVAVDPTQPTDRVAIDWGPGNN